MNRLSAALLVALLVMPFPGIAQSKPLEMKWSELPPMLTGHHVTLTLADGTPVKGEAVAIREDTILLDVSSPVKGYARGNGSVPRASIRLIDLERAKGRWGRTIGTVIGVLGGVTLGGYVAVTQHQSGGAATGTFLGIAAAGSVAGYFAGRGLDKRVTHIQIVP